MLKARSLVVNCKGLFTVLRLELKGRLGIPFDGSVYVDQMMELMETEEFKSMPRYPADGCVQKIDDIWVIKVAD